MSAHSLKCVSVALGTVLFGLSGCSGFPTFPTEEEIEKELEKDLISVDGDWNGYSRDTNAILMQFRLTQDGQQVTGSGRYQDANTRPAIPITTTGTYVRPKLSITFEGIIFEGLSVTGELAGDMESGAGISATPLLLVGERISRQVDLALLRSS